MHWEHLDLALMADKQKNHVMYGLQRAKRNNHILQNLCSKYPTEKTEFPYLRQ
ncbi:unnamed protein product, partial [Nesidiocoris tenuis]